MRLQRKSKLLLVGGIILALGCTTEYDVAVPEYYVRTLNFQEELAPSKSFIFYNVDKENEYKFGDDHHHFDFAPQKGELDYDSYSIPVGYKTSEDRSYKYEFLIYESTSNNSYYFHIHRFNNNLIFDTYYDEVQLLDLNNSEDVVVISIDNKISETSEEEYVVLYNYDNSEINSYETSLAVISDGTLVGTYTFPEDTAGIYIKSSRAQVVFNDRGNIYVFVEELRLNDIDDCGGIYLYEFDMSGEVLSFERLSINWQNLSLVGRSEGKIVLSGINLADCGSSSGTIIYDGNLNSNPLELSRGAEQITYLSQNAGGVFINNGVQNKLRHYDLSGNELNKVDIPENLEIIHIDFDTDGSYLMLVETQKGVYFIRSSMKDPFLFFD